MAVAWGANRAGQLGDDSYNDQECLTEVLALENAVDMMGGTLFSAGFDHSMASYSRATGSKPTGSGVAVSSAWSPWPVRLTHSFSQSPQSRNVIADSTGPRTCGEKLTETSSLEPGSSWRKAPT